MLSSTIEVARDQTSRPHQSTDINFSIFQAHTPRQRSHDGYIWQTYHLRIIATSWERYTFISTVPFCLSHRPSVNVTKVKWITAVYLSSRNCCVPTPVFIYVQTRDKSILTRENMKMWDPTKNKTPKVDNQCVQSAALPTLCRVTFRKYVSSNSTGRTHISQSIFPLSL